MQQIAKLQVYASDSIVEKDDRLYKEQGRTYDEEDNTQSSSSGDSQSGGGGTDWWKLCQQALLLCWWSPSRIAGGLESLGPGKALGDAAGCPK